MQLSDVMYKSHLYERLLLGLIFAKKISVLVYIAIFSLFP